jgi:DNA-binding transcriptional LysR family regulator
VPNYQELRAGSSDIACFVRTVDLGSFAAVGAEIGLTASGVSRIVTRLEDRLGVKLLHRTTRRLALTPEVETFLAHARGILSAVEAAEAAVASTHGRARGHIRLNSGTAFRSTSWPGCYRIFSLNIRTSRSTCRSATSASIQFSERVDVTNPGRPASRQRAHRRAAQRGSARNRSQSTLPRNARNSAALLRHNCMLLSGFFHLSQWPLFENGRRVLVAAKGNVTSDSAELLLDLALAGIGIQRLGDFLGESALSKDN